MAFFTCNFFSDALRLSVSANVILPEPAVKARGARKLPVLWLLHGLSDDHTIWERRTSIDRYADAYGIAVVMPAVDRSFYADMVRGNRYWTYISEELPAVMRSFFPLSSKRADNFVTGLSMGGYGSFKLALSHPNRYAAAASLSGTFPTFAAPDQGPHAGDTAWLEELGNIFGDLKRFRGSRNDLFALAAKVAKNPESAPRLYQACGTEDFLYQENLQFKAYAAEIGLPVTYEEGPGEHEWGFWDTYTQRVLAWLPIEK
ncbi:MAG: esterase family protein [Anaerolineales bacterium]|nr:esterase family protein [Anaerolineales bacterium]